MSWPGPCFCLHFLTELPPRAAHTDWVMSGGQPFRQIITPGKDKIVREEVLQPTANRRLLNQRLALISNL